MRVALAPTLGRLPVIRRSVAALDLALERAADEAAAGPDPDRRDALRRSLLAFIGLAPAPGAVAGFADATTVAARLDALDVPPAPLPPIAHRLLYVPGLTAAAVAAPLVADRVDRTVALVAMAGRCFI